jgi:ATP-dependent exoDNAse (exonuclease V) alpha subunit
MTVHKAQGLTVDTALVDTTGLTDRNAGYVAASRARHRTELHHTDADQLLEALRDDSFTPPKITAAEAHARVAQRLQRHREQRLAVDQRPYLHHQPPRRDVGRGR